MRVAFVTSLAPYYRRPLFRALAERHEVDYYFFSAGTERYITSALRRDALGHYSTDDAGYHRWLIAGEPFIPDLAWRLNHKHYDAVIKCLNGRLMTAWVTGLAWTSRLPLVIWTGMWYHPRTRFHQLTAPLTRAVYSHAAAIVTYGDHVKRFLADEQGVDPGKVFVAGQAVDPALFQAASLRSERDQVAEEALFVGQLEERKGVDHLLRAFGAISRPSARLTIVGDGSLRPHVERQVGVDRRISLVGTLSQDEIAERLARARCLVVPSITTLTDREPWGLVVNEAMHSGIPVIASTAVGAAAGGLVEHEVNGLVVQEGDSDELRCGLERLLRDADFARRLGAQASISVRAFDYPRMVAAFDTALAWATTRRTSERSHDH